MGTFEVDLRSGEGSWNAVEFELLGLKSSDMPGTPETFFRYVHPDDVGPLKAEWDEAVRTGELDAEFRVLRADGQERWLAGKGRFVCDSEGGGRPVRFLGVNYDITERKLAEKALRESEERFRTLANAMPQLAWVAKPDGHIFWYNQRWYDYTGTTPQQMEGWGWQSVHDPLKLPQVLEQWKTSLATGQTFEMEFPLRGADGRFRQFLTRGFPLKDAAGCVTQWFGTNTDVTERTHAEEKIRQAAADQQAANAALVESRRAALNLMEDALAARQQAEQVSLELRQREEQLRIFVEHAPAAIAMLDTDLRYVAASRRWLVDYGLPEQDVRGRSHYELFPEIPERWKEILRRCLAGAIERADEDSFDRADGTRQWLRWEVRPWHASPGTVGGIVIFSEDVTERKETADVLKFLAQCSWLGSNEGFFRSLAEFLAKTLGADFICIDRLHGDGKMAQTVAAYQDGKFEDNISYALHDTPCGDVVGKRICCFPSNVRGLFPRDEVLQQMGAEGYVGTTLWDSRGHPIGLIAIIWRRPLASPKRAEAILELVAVRAAGELERGLVEAKVARLTKLYAVLSQVNEVIVRIHDEKTLFGEVCRIVAEEGKFPLVWIGERHEQQIVPVASSGPAADYLKEIRLEVDGPLGSGPTGTAIREGRFVVNDDFGANPATSPWREPALRHGFRSSAAFPLRRRGKPIGSLTLYALEPGAFDEEQVQLLDALGNDISYALDSMRQEHLRAAAEEDLLRTAEELMRSNKDLEQFAYVASHDLREPLRMVSAFTGLLRDRYQGKLDAQAGEYISFAIEGAHRMQTLIDGLLAYSRIGARGGKTAPINAQEPLDTALANLRGAIEASNARITQDPMPTITGDALQMAQVFQNLIGNAIKYRKSDVALEIHIGAQRITGDQSSGKTEPPEGFHGLSHMSANTMQCLMTAESFWLFSVKDNGIGIDPQFFGKIFEIFQRLQTRDKYPGTGIGLAVCKKIVERHGGRIWLESQPGTGATFFFTIPEKERSAVKEQEEAGK